MMLSKSQSQAEFAIRTAKAEGVALIDVVHT